MSELIGKYSNGNAVVEIYENGTRVIETEDETFVPEFPLAGAFISDCKHFTDKAECWRIYEQKREIK